MSDAGHRVLGALLDYDPVVNIDLGPLSISPHGLGIALGYLLGGQLFFLPAAERRGITQAQVYSMLTRGAIGAIVGARVAFVMHRPNQYIDDPVAIFRVWEGGISLLGGIAGAVLFAATRMRSDGLSFWRVMDAVAPGLAFGIIIGRIGDLVIADHLGKPTSFFLGYRCPEGPLIVGETIGSPCEAGPGRIVHQPALYDLFSAVLLVGFLLWLRRRPRYDGFLVLVFTVWYGYGRLIQDFFRTDVTHGTGLTGSQWSAMIAATIALWWLVSRRRTPWASGRGPHRSNADATLHPFDTPEYRAEFKEWVGAILEAEATEVAPTPTPGAPAASISEPDGHEPDRREADRGEPDREPPRQPD